MSKTETPKIATDPPGRGYTLTPSQYKRKSRGQSIWERDKQVKNYTYSKGKYV